MSLPVALLILFVLGAFHDVLWTVYIRAVSSNSRIVASVTAGVLTAFGYVAWALMLRTGADGTLAGIVVYSIGGAIGTYLGFKGKMSPPPPGPNGTGV